MGGVTKLIAEKSRAKRAMTQKIREHYTATSFTLNNGIKMPKIGLATYQTSNLNSIELAIDAAMKAGYLVFDTAAMHNDEVAVGEAIQKGMAKHDLKREDIFIISKLAPKDLGKYKVVNAAYMKSLENLQIDYADLYLINYPGRSKLSIHDLRGNNLRRTTWESLMQIYEEGRVDAIGVANFNINHLMGLDIKPHEVVPAVNQVEWHPQSYQDKLLKYCRNKDICLQAYGSLGGASNGDQTLFKDPVVTSIANNHASRPTQVLYAWALQQDVAVISKSANPEHIDENIDINFLLSEVEINTLNGIRDKAKNQHSILGFRV